MFSTNLELNGLLSSVTCDVVCGNGCLVYKNVTVPYQYQVSYNKYFYGIHATSTDVDGYL